LPDNPAINLNNYPLKMITLTYIGVFLLL